MTDEFVPEVAVKGSRRGVSRSRYLATVTAAQLGIIEAKYVPARIYRDQLLGPQAASKNIEVYRTTNEFSR